MKRIGITGGIGSGKSTVCRIFESLGYHVYYADARARALMTTNYHIIAGVKEVFGEISYLSDGALNRKHIGGIVFQDRTMLDKLNAIVHPETRRDFYKWIQELPTDYNKSFILKEAAILYESGTYKDADAVITVYAPKSLRLQRVVARDELPSKAILNRMDKQWADIEKIHRSDFIIFNDETHHIIPQVKEAIEAFS